MIEQMNIVIVSNDYLVVSNIFCLYNLVIELLSVPVVSMIKHITITNVNCFVMIMIKFHFQLLFLQCTKKKLLDIVK